MNYSRHRKSIEKMYKDTASISRYGEVEKPSGETKHELQKIYESQPCHLSQKALASNQQTEAQNDISYETKLFISPDLEIFQGDAVEVTRMGRTLSFTAGEPFIYPTHQEISMQREERA